MQEGPRALIATTTWWPSLGVLASALEEEGFDVTMLCPDGHVAMQARRFRRLELDRHAPAASVAAALAEVAPVLVIPGDERVVDVLREMHAREPRWRALIEETIGRPSSHALLTGRVALLQAASRSGFAVPETQTVASEADVEAWRARLPPPWIFKVDGAWGGEGVRIADDAAGCRRAYRALRRGPTLALALRRRFINRDPFPWHDHRARRPPAISAQAHVHGRPGSCAVFARAGEVLGVTIVEAIATASHRGPSTLVRAVDRPDLVAQVRRLVAHLGLSGFLGFDVIWDGGGRAMLIEMNPRITMPCRMAGPFGISPIAAAAKAHGATSSRDARTGGRSLFASFPLAWLADPFARDLVLCHADIPWREPDMVRDALRPLWPERGPIAFMPARFRSLRDFMFGRRRPDYRMRSAAWWATTGGVHARETRGPDVVGDAPAASEPACQEEV